MESIFQLRIAHVGTIVVVVFGVAVSHECHHSTVVNHGLYVTLVYEDVGQCIHVIVITHQWNADSHLLVDAVHVIHGEVVVFVVHEVLDIRVAHTAVLFTRNHLE